MATQSTTPTRRDRLNRGPVADVRRLLADREFIKTTAFVLPRQTKLRVLQLMERLRAARIPRRKGAPRPAAEPLPEMTASEIVREINWRIGTVPPGDAEELVRYLRRLIRRRAERRRWAVRASAGSTAAPR